MLFGVLVVGLAGFGGAYYARGFLAGRRHFGLYATLLVLEGGSRVLFPLAVAIGLAERSRRGRARDRRGALVSMTVLPFAFRHRGAHTCPRRSRE